MNIVIDTNVILSAFLTEGLSHKVFLSCIGKHKLYISEWILFEVKDKLDKKFSIPKPKILNLLNFLKKACYLIEPKGEVIKGSRDVKDNPILLLADNINADLIITGDKDLLEMIHYKRIKIVNPRYYFENHYDD